MLRSFIVITILIFTKLLFAQVKFEQTGTASYYANKFHGRFTTSGERFNQHKYTAAHASLPFNTWVKVTCLFNNKSVVVKVNDRCKRNNPRIIDVSKSAAKELGIIYSGVARVKIEVVADSLGNPFTQVFKNLWPK